MTTLDLSREAPWHSDGWPIDDERPDRWARLLVEHAIGLRQDQRIEICCGPANIPFAYRVGDAAYTAGAGEVCYRFVDPLQNAQLIRRGRPEQILLHHVGTQKWLADVLRTRSALLQLDGPTYPELGAELGRTHPESHQLFHRENVAVSLDFHRRAVDRGLCPAVTAVSPTPAWARQVFPELPGDEAFRRLADLIFHFTFADRDDGLAYAAALSRRLEARAAALDKLEIREIRVTGGGNDFRVGVSEKSRWRDGSRQTTGGQHFAVNVPSFEVFTTPDRRRTQGRLVASRRIRLPGGLLVEGLELDFHDGRVVGVRAREGAEAFGRWLDVDEGARHLGEFALVGDDSPIARCGTIFGHTLLDENAAAHVAVGFAFTAALDGGEALSSDQLDAVGYNRSDVHIDIPFGSVEVDVTATDRRGNEVVVLEAGAWARRFGPL